MIRRLLLTATLLLAACSAGEAPRIVAPTAAEPAYADFGTLRVRYNALPTQSLNKQMAERYGVPRDAGLALVMVSLRQLRNGEEVAVDGQARATAIDLQGERTAIVLKPVKTGDSYTDHIGTFAISPRNHYRIEVAVEAQGQRGPPSSARES